MSDERDTTTIAVPPDLVLTGFRESDRSALVWLCNDPEVYRHTLRIPYPYRLEDADAFLALTAERTREQHGPQHFAIRRGDGQLLGCCGFDDVRRGHRAELGYWLGRPYRGQGIMTRAVRVICNWAVQRWQLVKITAYVFEQNPASMRVLEKNGFELEGRLRRHYRKDEQLLDARLYGLLV